MVIGFSPVAAWLMLAGSCCLIREARVFFPTPPFLDPRLPDTFEKRAAAPQPIAQAAPGEENLE
jgi:hypothetical protein